MDSPALGTEDQARQSRRPLERRMTLLICLLLSLVSACGGAESTKVRMDFGKADDFFASPFPSATRLPEDGEIDLSGFPNAGDEPLVSQILELSAASGGFGLTSAIFFPLTGPLPEGFVLEPEEASEENSPVGLLPLREDVLPSHLLRHPVDVHYQEDGGPYGAPHVLSLLPIQGIPLAPGEDYIAYVKKDLEDSRGRDLSADENLELLIAGKRPEGMTRATFQLYRRAIDRLDELSVSSDELAGLTVFRTGDPTAELLALYESARELTPLALDAPLGLTETFDDYCVFEGLLAVPVYQTGKPPYATGGGFPPNSVRPLPDRFEDARMVVTIPKGDLPESGWPVVLFNRTGAGGDRPLVDRGPHATKGEPAAEAGSGPARLFASAGFAGVSIDGPHGGLRNVTGADEQVLFFNFQNPLALRDNVRQAALELALEAELLSSLQLDTTECSAATPMATFDLASLSLMGHSMGATISPLALLLNPRFQTTILSGAGGSFIENIMFKQSPFPTKTFAEVLLGYPSDDSLHRHDPLLNLLQWALEPADPPVYASTLSTGADRPHSLVLQGIVDTYILPPIANAMNLSLGLDLAGAPLDMEGDYAPLHRWLPFRGTSAIDLPAQGNSWDGTTQVVVQHSEDGIEDGHEIGFQVEGARNQIRCFLETFAERGLPAVPSKNGKLDAACPE